MAEPAGLSSCCTRHVAISNITDEGLLKGCCGGTYPFASAALAAAPQAAALLHPGPLPAAALIPSVPAAPSDRTAEVAGSHCAAAITTTVMDKHVYAVRTALAQARTVPSALVMCCRTVHMPR